MGTSSVHWQKVKAENKRDLARFIKERTNIVVDPESLFDIQVKRLHEYKRQHLNALYLIGHYRQLKRTGGIGATPRTAIFGGKAAPGYRMAKLIIKLINSVGEIVNQDPEFPAGLQREERAARLSGCRSIRTDLHRGQRGLRDREHEVRDERQVGRRKAAGYAPRSFYDSNPDLREAIDLIADGFFSNGDRELFNPLVESLLTRDDYMLLADYQAYVERQQRVSDAYRDQENWARMSILNSARVGRFSSDRSISEYCRDIWHVGQAKTDHES